MTFFDKSIEHLTNLVEHEEFKKYVKKFNSHDRFILLGNGGSNAVAAHIAQDFLSKHKIALAVTDTAMLSCFANDFEYKNVFSKFLSHYASFETFVIIISSSGNSENILEAIQFCEENKISYGILTGFDSNNKARSKDKTYCCFDYHVDSHDYGVVECVHQIFLHGIR